MKHLRGYKLFESGTKLLMKMSEDIIDVCKDILLDMSDDDVKCKIEYQGYTKHLFAHQSRLDKIEGVVHLVIGDYSRGKSFDPGYYVKVLEHLNSYLNSNGYQYFSNGSPYSTWEEKMESINRFKGTSAGKLTLMDIYWVRDIA